MLFLIITDQCFHHAWKWLNIFLMLCLKGFIKSLECVEISRSWSHVQFKQKHHVSSWWISDDVCTNQKHSIVFLGGCEGSSWLVADCLQVNPPCQSQVLILIHCPVSTIKDGLWLQTQSWMKKKKHIRIVLCYWHLGGIKQGTAAWLCDLKRSVISFEGCFSIFIKTLS